MTGYPPTPLLILSAFVGQLDGTTSHYYCLAVKPPPFLRPAVNNRGGSHADDQDRFARTSSTAQIEAREELA